MEKLINMAVDANYSQTLNMIFDKFPSITKDLSAMEKLYSAPGKKLPRLKLRRKVKSPVRSTSKRNREQADSAEDESEAEALSNTKVLEEKVSAVELHKVERAKEQADAKVSRLQAAAQFAYAEVEKLSKEIQALEASRLNVAEVGRLSQEIEVLQKTQAENIVTTTPSPSPGAKRWSSEVMTVRLNNKKLDPEDYEMDVEDKGDEIDIKLRIK